MSDYEELNKKGDPVHAYKGKSSQWTDTQERIFQRDGRRHKIQNSFKEWWQKSAVVLASVRWARTHPFSLLVIKMGRHIYFGKKSSEIRSTAAPAILIAQGIEKHFLYTYWRFSGH